MYNTPNKKSRAALAKPFKSPLLRDLKTHGTNPPPQTPTKGNVFSKPKSLWTNSEPGAMTSTKISSPDFNESSCNISTPRTEPPLLRTKSRTNMINTPTRPKRRSIQNTAPASLPRIKRQNRQEGRMDKELLELCNQRAQLRFRLNEIEGQNIKLRSAISRQERNECKDLDELVLKWKRCCFETADKLWEIAGASFTRLIADSELEGKSSYTNMGQNNPFGTLNEHSSVEENQENSSQENECVDDNELDPKIKMLKYMGIDISLFTDG